MRALRGYVWTAASAVLLAGTLAGCSATEEVAEVREVPHNVRVLELDRTDVVEYFEVAGPVTPVRAADLAAEESGPIVALGADKGESVPAGGLIVEQERAILAAELAAAQAALANQEYNVDKVRQLHAAGKVSRIELLAAETQYERARALTEVGRVRWERAAVTAPFAGVVVDRWVELGELLTPGRPVARVIDPYTLKIEAFLTDNQVGWVSLGSPATVLLGQSLDQAAGTVTFISPEADRMTGKFGVEVEIPNPELRHRSGVIGRARLPKHVTAGAVAVPRDAILAGRVGPTAFVIEGDRARLRQLELGAFQGLMVVVESGLAAGDRLVVRGHRDLREGNLVVVTETATAADGSLPADPTEVTAAGAGTRVGSESTGASVEANR